MAKNVNRHYLALDLINAPNLINAYKEFHRKGNVWTSVLKSISDAGVLDMEIYLTGNRLFMIMEVDDQFSFSAKAESDATNSAVQSWESLMMKYQQQLDWAKAGEKWIPMERIFSLQEHQQES